MLLDVREFYDDYNADVSREQSSSFARHQATIVALLFSGYAAQYFCRSDLSATAPLLIADLHANGYNAAQATLAIGMLASVGTAAYGFGKFFLSWAPDFFGGKRNFLLGMLGAIVFTAVFAVGRGLPALVAAWTGNRLFQSLCWPSLVKVTSKWFAFSVYGSVMAILSLSFLAGDAVTRGAIGALIGAGFAWRTIFLLAAVALAIVFLANLFFLKESSTGAGFGAPGVYPGNLFGAAGAQERPQTLRALFDPLRSSKAFAIVCVLSFGTTLLREALGTWTPTFYTTIGLNAAQAAAFSALSPIAGIVSVLGAGWLSDRLGALSRARIAFVGLALTAGSLLGLALVTSGGPVLAIALLTAAAFFNAGPYSYLAGAMALDFGGRKGAGASSGIIDGVGYIGGAMAGFGVARLAVTLGWGGAFMALAAVTAATALFAAVLVRVQTREVAP
ncbi:MAG TPA: MFS transporter [Candidatus Cybelea sp.]